MRIRESRARIARETGFLPRLLGAQNEKTPRSGAIKFGEFLLPKHNPSRIATTKCAIPSSWLSIDVFFREVQTFARPRWDIGQRSYFLAHHALAASSLATAAERFV